MAAQHIGGASGLFELREVRMWITSRIFRLVGWLLEPQCGQGIGMEAVVAESSMSQDLKM